jgi:sensory rhodopsin
MSSQTPAKVAAVFFFLFSFYFYSKQSYLVSAICLIAFTNYSAISMNVGKIVQPSGTYDYVPRYIDWSLTTPLLLLTVLLRCNIRRMDVFILFIVLDLLMVYAGYLGIQAQDDATRNVMFAIGTFFYLAIFALLWQYKPPHRLFFFLFIAWMFYPIVWILHETESAGMTNHNYNIILATLDIFSKIGYGFILA